ncbi:hypothetical protein M422DRAFT_261181 [Sphaerobolus stellatus SS14]|uniref:Uncharacterized protein n=1 Tax=Sphaerobolus stellatus (strain SS14) TaxID=990650 RepID=A0A0C9VGI3_SPHS4|nr:hypothetical protein M422DRAFT_261181 [Sphaerobolus stellatus SS14]
MLVFPPRHAPNGHQPLPYPAAVAPAVNTTNPNPNLVRLASAPPPPIPTSFVNSTDEMQTPPSNQSTRSLLGCQPPAAMSAGDAEGPDTTVWTRHAPRTPIKS